MVIQDSAYLTTISSRRAPSRAEQNTAPPLTCYRKMTEYDGDIIAPTVEKPTDRAWWKSATVYQGELDGRDS